MYRTRAACRPVPRARQDIASPPPASRSRCLSNPTPASPRASFRHRDAAASSPLALFSVTPAKAGVQGGATLLAWIPACAGMTEQTLGVASRRQKLLDQPGD